MPEKIQSYFTTSTFQSCDGSNFTTAGYNVKFGHGLSGYLGMGTNFESAPIGVIDFKESNPYVKGGIVSQNLRIRTKFDDGFSSTQIRVSPCTVNIPVGERTTLYANPHYSGCYDYKDKEWNHSAGIFVGATQKLGENVSISLEAQRYNLQDITDNDGGNWSFNAIVSVKLP